MGIDTPSVATDHRAHVGPGVAPQRRDEAQADAHDRGEQQRVEGQFDGRGQALDEDLGDRPPVAERVAQVDRRHLSQVEDELDSGWGSFEPVRAP